MFTLSGHAGLSVKFKAMGCHTNARIVSCTGVHPSIVWSDTPDSKVSGVIDFKIIALLNWYSILHPRECSSWQCYSAVQDDCSPLLNSIATATGDNWRIRCYNNMMYIQDDGDLAVD